MLRARLSNGAFVLGIDAENVRRLKKGQPIIIDLTVMGGHDHVLLMYGNTLDDIRKEIEAAAGPLPPAQDLPTNLKEQ